MDFWLPVVFAGLMALAILIYVVLDGYDLGVGVLLRGAEDKEKDMMIASIGPFWDANETWLVLRVGILLIAFPMAHGISVVAGYGLLGATWLIMKSEDELQRKAVRWAQRALWLTAAGIAAVSIATPLVSTRVFDKWFSFPQFLLLSQIPAISIALILTCHFRLRKLAKRIDSRQWLPFALAVSIFLLAFAGLAYSLFPYLIIDELTIWDAASATNSLQFVLWGVVITLPAILGYTVFAYRVFWGKTRELSYD